LIEISGRLPRWEGVWRNPDGTIGGEYNLGQQYYRLVLGLMIVVKCCN